MKQITFETFNQLSAVARKQFDYNIEFSEARDMWAMSVYYNKLQNQLIADNEENEAVRSFQLFDEESKEVRSFSIRANKKYSRLQWFILLLGVSLCTLSRQQINTILNN